MKIIILAAGMGGRLGRPHPKALTLLNTGRTIMQHQIKGLLRYVDLHDIYIVVGFKKELIMEAFPDLIFIYNDYFDTTNTSKSLLRGLQKVKGLGDDVLWINGDVVFDHRIIERIITSNSSCMVVNKGFVGEEEVKYLTSDDGTISAISKKVDGGLGEALGINKIMNKEINLLIKHLEECDDSDYFEKAIEKAIIDGLRIFPIDVSDLPCMEVDFKEDLVKANELLECKKR